MRYLDICLAGLSMMLIFALLAVWKLLAGDVADGGAALIFAGGGSMFLGAGLLAAFLDWRDGRRGGRRAAGGGSG